MIYDVCLLGLAISSINLEETAECFVVDDFLQDSSTEPGFRGSLD